MWKRFAEVTAITLLVICGSFYYWTEGISDPSRLHGSKRVEVSSTAGAVDIVGAETGDVQVTVDGEAASNRGVRVSVDQTKFPVRVRINDIPQGTRVRVTVPSDAGIAVNMTAGQLRVSGVRGDVAAVLRSGEMILNLTDNQRFSSAEASVLAGEIHAPIFQREKGGLFRYFRWHGKGANTLDAHVTAGRVVLD